MATIKLETHRYNNRSRGRLSKSETEGSEKKRNEYLHVYGAVKKRIKQSERSISQIEAGSQ